MRSNLIIKSEKKRLVYAPVYTPFHVDTDGEAMEPAEVEKMAHEFMLNGRFDCIDVNHDRIRSGCRVVESFVARKGDPDFTAGEWVLGVKVMREDLWQKVLKGELNGFSFGSNNVPTRTDYVVDLLQPVSGAGTTEKSEGGPLPSHRHEVIVEFAADSSMVPTRTSEALGHSHKVSRATATEQELDHSHRLVLSINC
ncbi:MAG: hypothetical protein FJY85_03505 [Deltaproteobacteria bacterium]|nr:hypothetical protein [Deltaproteobacteria bacterium]